MKKFALVFVKDLTDNGLGYIWLWKTKEFIEQHKDDIIFVEQGGQETSTYNRLVFEVQKTYPNAVTVSDTHFTYIKIR